MPCSSSYFGILPLRLFSTRWAIFDGTSTIGRERKHIHLTCTTASCTRMGICYNVFSSFILLHCSILVFYSTSCLLLLCILSLRLSYDTKTFFSASRVPCFHPAEDAKHFVAVVKPQPSLYLRPFLLCSINARYTFHSCRSRLVRVSLYFS